MFLPSLLLVLLAGTAAVAQEEKPAVQEPQDKPVPAPESDPRRDLPEEEPARTCALGFEADFRAGGWWIGGFDAVLPAGRRKIESALLFDAGLDLRLDYHDWLLTLGGDYAGGQDLRLASGSLLVGRRWHLSGEESGLSLSFSAGPLFGSLEATVDGFGDFQSAVGFEGRVDLLSQVQESLGIGFWFSYRQISFDFDEAVLSGDTKAGGAGVAAGASLLLRF